MAMTSSFTLAEEELSCPICFEDFNQNDKTRHPKLLMCLHTFCSGCIETLRKHDGTLQCSICRTLHNVYRTVDLMDNYIIFEYLRIKQEAEDEKLANELRKEYNESVQKIQEQEQRDAQLAKKEEQLNLIEEARRKAAEEIARKEKEEEERLKLAEELRQNRNQTNVDALDKEENDSDFSDAEDRNSETESSVNNLSRKDSDTSIDCESCASYQDLDDESQEEETEVLEELDPELNQTDEESSQRNSDDDDDATEEVICLSSDEDEVLSDEASSDNEEENNDALPQPDLFSEEFSGVSRPRQRSPEKLSTIVPSVLCSERPDGTIIVLDDPRMCNEAAAVKPTAMPRYRKPQYGSSQHNLRSRSPKKGGENSCHEYASFSTDSGDDNEWVDLDSTSSNDDNLTSSPTKYSSHDKKSRYSRSNGDEENCQIQ